MMAMRPRVSAMRRHREKNRAVDPVVTKITAHGTTISLRSQVNARLTDPLGEIPGINAYSLAELPSGTHIFGGVPFDIRGLLQLNGTAENPNGRVLPAEIADIRIGQKLKKIHLLHGALNIPSPRFTVVIRFVPGFTLIELLVVVGVIAVRVALLLPALSASKESAV
jgi:prepilin-type N-terminal cleavage/methylation domain-containing protein